MDRALLEGLIDVDEYVQLVLDGVDPEHSIVIRNRLKRDRDDFLTRLNAVLGTRNKHVLAGKYASRWRLICAQRKLEREAENRRKADEEIDEIRGEAQSKARQLRDAQARISELSATRSHVQDVSGLLAQVKDLVKQLEVEKAEKALILSRYEGENAGSKKKGTKEKAKMTPLSSSTHYNTRSGNESVTRMVREYQSRIQRLEDELAEEKLKRANESAIRLEKEAECAKLRRDVDDAKAEVISLQLKIARMEAGADFSSSLPSSQGPVLEERFDNILPEFHELPKSQMASTTVPRKSFFRSATSSLNATGTQSSRRVALGTVKETVVDENDSPSECAQQ